jgi:transglutaminase-like putative cysteine protease
MTSTIASPDPSLTPSLPASQVTHTPLPEWVKYQPWPEEIEDPQGAWTDNGVLRLLHETQVSLLQAGFASHVRAVQRVLTRNGAERAAQLIAEFDPAYERVEVHHFRIWRAGSCVEHAPTSTDTLHLLRREKQLERLALNGRLSATLLVPDVRVDDRVEFAITTYSNNPVLSGRYVGWMVFNSYGPWVETRQRLLRPPARSLHFKAFNQPPEAVREITDELEESRWSLARQERRMVEDLVPPWTIKTPSYQVSEYEEWRDVAQLFEAHYRDNVLPEDLAHEVDDLKSRFPRDADRAVEWLRFVQRHIRYFALSLGEGGLVPRSLETIWTGRFGDCKDAARLYVAGAQRLGLNASAALVSTTHGLSLAQFLPSTQAFNHMVVRLRLGGATYWLDPTLQAQSGSLEDIDFPHPGWALPVTSDTTELEALPVAQSLEHIRCEDEIELGPKPGSRAVLRRRIDLRHWTANNVRHRIQNEGGSKLSGQFLQELHGVWLGIVETSPVTIEDDSPSNRLTLHFAYEIADCWKREPGRGRLEFSIADHFTIKELAAPKSTRRNSEILLGRPRTVRWRAHIQMPHRWGGRGWLNISGEQGAILRNDLTIDSRTVILERVLVIDEWSLPADRAEAYARLVSDLSRNAAKLYARTIFGRIFSVAGILGSVPHWLILVVVSLLILALPSMCGAPTHPWEH